MNDGAIQGYPLTLDKILTHAAAWHPQAGLVSANDGGIVKHAGYAELLDRSRRMSTLLAANGVKRGDRVATLAWNSQGHFESWYGIMAMGAVCHTLNPRLTPLQLAWMLNQSGAALLLASPDLADLALAVAADAPMLRQILVIDGGEALLDLAGSPRIAAVNLDNVAPKVAWGDFDENTPCGLCFTSGTTGAPKGVTYTHRSNYLHTLRQLQADVLALTSRETILVAVPMFHANAWGLPFAAPAVGANMVLPGRNLDGASLAKLIRDHGVTLGVGVPTVWLGLIEHLDATGEELPSLKRIAVGGAPMPPALMARLEKRLQLTVQTTWGMTELSPLGTATPAGTLDRRPEVSGRPALGLDLLLTDASGRPLDQQRGTEGHLKVRGAAVVERYFGHDNLAVDEDGWFDTGDLARIEESGDLVITGRSKDLIKSGGEWINPAEIEALISRVPQVSLAAVVGRHDAKWGERPILCVELNDTIISDDDLLNTVRPHIAAWWVPDEVVRLESMPLAATGKIDKMRLRRDYGQA